MDMNNFSSSGLRRIRGIDLLPPKSGESKYQVTLRGPDLSKHTNQNNVLSSQLSTHVPSYQYQTELRHQEKIPRDLEPRLIDFDTIPMQVPAQVLDESGLSYSTLEEIEKTVPRVTIGSVTTKTVREDLPCPITDGTSSFSGLLTPVTSFIGGASNMCFRFRVRPDLCVLQWKEFTGMMGANGVNYITCVQGVSPLPDWMVTQPVSIIYKGVEKTGRAEIQSDSGMGVKFWLGVGPEQVLLQDVFTIRGGNISWIPRDSCKECNSGSSQDSGSSRSSSSLSLQSY